MYVRVYACVCECCGSLLNLLKRRRSLLFCNILIIIIIIIIIVIVILISTKSEKIIIIIIIISIRRATRACYSYQNRTYSTTHTQPHILSTQQRFLLREKTTVRLA